LNFSWSPEQTELHGRTKEFARALLGKPPARGDAFPRAAWDACGEFGLLGLSVPTEFGGMGLDSLTTARVEEAFGFECRDAGLMFSASAHLFACLMPIVEHGSAELKRRVLPGLARGRLVAGNAMTEAEAGSDVSAISTRALRDSGGYVISGTKSYVTNGPIADVFVTYATVDPSQGFMGVAAFVIDRDTPGVVVGKPFEKMGLSTSPISSVYFESCRVPPTNRLGAEGQGASIFQRSMQWERTCLFAGFLGAMDRQIGEVAEHARKRTQGRRPIGKHQAIAHRIADMRLRHDAAQLLLYRACWLMDSGADAALAVALAKLAISESAVDVGLGAIQIHGGMGYAVETGVEVTLRDAIPLTLFSGTSEIQRNIVAARMGL
jgi:alkylation response protein AidB-like acyl-CoA dehydrogenase